MKSLIRRITEDLLELLPAFLFFFIMFHILFFTRSLTLEEYGITLHTSIVAVVGALIVSKAIFFADKAPFLNFYPGRPLLLNVLFKTLAFGVLTFLFLFAEELFHQVQKHGGLSAAFERLTTDVAWPVFWSGEIWVMVLLLFFCAARELIRAVGSERVGTIFFKG